MKIINFFGSPGSGKSTLCSGVFYELKMAGLNVEIVTEYAKDMVWENRANILADPIYMLAKQHRRIARLQGLVDYVVVDSPIILSHFYLPKVCPYKETLEKLIDEVFHMYDNINIFINRSHIYSEVGRRETESEANVISNKIKSFLDENSIKCLEVESGKITPVEILEILEI
ncbi:ATP-binding protein [Candidatus Dojkabacteria bacterium]|jgi:nicotinamide riboside kinase|nr:ATP-binding protein [Candidatus Dojkabacteria bacterium]